MTAPVTPADLPAPASPGPYRVVMVCTGNICRSAMAEVVLTDRLAHLAIPTDGPDGVVVSSGGVSDEEHGHPTDPRARRVLASFGYGEGDDEAARATAALIAGHHAHRVSDAEILSADLVLAMTQGHRRELVRRAERLGADPSRVRMFREYDPQTMAGQSAGGGGAASLDVPDPWYGTMEDFVDTLEVVERVSEALSPALVELAAARR